MKISNILFALLLIVSVSCGNKKTEDDHGHEHTNEEAHGHPHEAEDADHHQEEFKVEKDSAVHTHEDGATHSDH